jgi:hypothetical protein
MDSTFAGILTETKAVQLLNAFFSICFTPVPKVTLVRDVHPLKHCPVIFSTLFGMMILASLVQSEKAKLSIEVTELGRVIDFKLSQLLNAPVPMNSSVFGNLIDLRQTQ